MLDFCCVCHCDFHCGQYDVDVHVSVADLDEDPSFKDDPNKLISKPERKTYAELTTFP